MPVYITPPPGNPLTRLLAAIIVIVVLAGAFMLGILALAVVAGLALILGVAAWFRTWWIRRRLRRDGSAEKPGGRSHQVIEAEYTVVSRRRNGD